MTIRPLLGCLTALTLHAGVAFAQTDGARELIDIVYPVADLVVPFDVDPKAGNVVTQEKELMARIAKNVAPATWGSGGGPGHMHYSAQGFNLRVHQTPAAHAELKSYLAKLQRGQVALEFRIISTPQIPKLGVTYAQADGIAYAVLTPRQLADYETALERDRTSTIQTLPKITTFEGQEATLSVGDTLTRTGIDFDNSDIKAPAVMEEKIFLGTQARFVTAISADGRTVTLKVKMLTRKLFDLPPAVKPPLANPDPDNPAAKPSPCAEFKLDVSARVPDDRTVAFFVGKELADIPASPTTAPFSRIPYVSRLFRNRVYGYTIKETIVLITPRIIRETDGVSVEALRGEIRAEEDGKLPVVPTSR